jgi:Ser/Thr protein kinase RdoA (MazF antagonist)
MMGVVRAQELAAAFGLGEPIGGVVEAARGWGGHNVVYRLDITVGSWAIKSLRREVDGLLVERFEVEMAAFGGGIAMARPVPASAVGEPVAVVAGQRVRCHQWIDGASKLNEQTSVEESALMGELVAHLHGLSLPWSSRFDDHIPGEDESSWAALAEDAERAQSPLAPFISDNLATLERLADRAVHARQDHRQSPRIGSHRDLNAHNVLFTAGGLRLIDWEAAGPVYPPWERANYATLWSARDHGRYDLEALSAFLRGYRRGGGEIGNDDPDTLGFLVDNVENWTNKNVRWAIQTPTPDQDQSARYLIEALLMTPTTIERRRRHLQDGIARLN